MKLPFSLSKKNKRKISELAGHEFLYDYLSKNLDSERMTAMDELVRNSPEAQAEIKKMKRALGYLDEIAKTDIAPHLLEQAGTPNSYVQGLLQKIRFQQWPPGIKLGLEVMAMTALVVSTALVIPWHRVFSYSWSGRDIVLAEVENDYKPKSIGDNALLPVAETQVPKEAEFKDEQSTAAPQKIDTKSKAPVTKVPAPSPTPDKTAAMAVAVVSESPDGKGQGWLHRGNIAVVNLTSTSEKFVKKIDELGGRKAGEVELGWKKPEGRYFHFTIPESRLEELQKFISQYGSLKLLKEKHERVMPDGIIRLIITVSETKKKTK